MQPSPRKICRASSVARDVIDLLLPRTDAGVMAQVVGVTLVFAAALFAVRRQAHWRLLTVGLWILTYALVGLRLLH